MTWDIFFCNDSRNLKLTHPKVNELPIRGIQLFCLIHPSTMTELIFAPCFPAYSHNTIGIMLLHNGNYSTLLPPLRKSS